MHSRSLESILHDYVSRDTEALRLFDRDPAVELNNRISTASIEELQTLETSLDKLRRDNNFYEWFNIPIQICDAGIFTGIAGGVMSLLLRAIAFFEEKCMEKDMMDTRLYLGIMLINYFLNEENNHITEYDRCKARINNVQEQINKRKNDLVSLTPGLTPLDVRNLN